MIYEMCRKFADEELAPNAHEWDKKHSFPKEAVAQLVSMLWSVLQCTYDGAMSIHCRSTCL